MEYVKLYVSLRDDPKIIGLSDKAFRAYVNALCWCGFHETDGLLAVGMMPQKLIDELRAAGLVDGWTTHNWPKFQRTHAELETLRTERREAGRSGGLAKAKANANQTTSTVPSKNVAELEVEVRSRDLEPKNPALSAVPDNRPDHDQVYLAKQLTETWGTTPSHLGLAALQRLNTAHGRAVVTNALRELHGFPPSEAVRSLYAYVESIAAAEVSA